MDAPGISLVPFTLQDIEYIVACVVADRQGSSKPTADILMRVPPAYIDPSLPMDQYVEAIAQDVFNGLEADDFIDLAAAPRSSLAMIHHTAGRYIRNAYKMWERPWKEDVVHGVDHSPEHPDNLSMLILNRLKTLVEEAPTT